LSSANLNDEEEEEAKRRKRKKKKKIAVFASGRGSDFQAILDHIELRVLLGAKIALLVCNHKDAPVIQRAQRKSIPVIAIEGVSKRKFQDNIEKEKHREEFEREIMDGIKNYGIDYIALAGFDQVLSSLLISEYQNKIVNIHPAYDLKRFGGRGMVGERVHEAVLNSKEDFSGCTVHFVDNTIDGGPTIIKQQVPVKPNDTVETLSQRVLVYEHRTYPKALQLLVDNRVIVSGKCAYVDLYSDGWDILWNKRQRRYIEFQEKSWETTTGKPLEVIL
jgi:phosphoribosylglycinamide formyltransferase-1